MTVTDDYLDRVTARLDRAQTEVSDTPSIEGDADLGADFDLDVAYRVQERLIARREQRGETVVGVKLGFTSRAKMAQMGVFEVIVGRLTDAMAIPDGGETDLAGYIHPKAEPEVAYRLARDVDLDDPDLDILDMIDAIAPAIEIIDSRYRDFRFTYADVVADNTSAAGFAIGAWQPVRAAADLPVRLRVGDAEATGSTAAILDDPANALTALLEMCRRRRIPLRAGDIVLAGAATAALPLGTDTAECVIDGLGAVRLTGVRR